MEVSSQDLYPLLPDILKAISKAKFVSFDLELSGIGRKRVRDYVVHDRPDKQTLQARYEETKAAAEAYQVLQLGFTTVELDEETGAAAATSAQS